MNEEMIPLFETLTELLDASDDASDPVMVAVACIMYLCDRAAGDLDFDDGVQMMLNAHRQVLENRSVADKWRTEEMWH